VRESEREEGTYEHSVQRPTTKRHESNQSKQQYMYNKFGYDIDSNYNPNPYKYITYICTTLYYLVEERK